MPSLDSQRLRLLVRQALDRQASSAGAEPAELAAAARRAYGALADVTAPLIGHNGLSALTGRAVHLARRRHAWLLDAAEPASAEEPFGSAMSRAERQTLAEAAEGTVEVLAVLCGLLVALIGEGLTRHLLHMAWAVVLPADTGEEKEPR